MLKTNMQDSEYDASHIQIASSFLSFAIQIYSKALYIHRNQYQVIFNVTKICLIIKIPLKRDDTIKEECPNSVTQQTSL